MIGIRQDAELMKESEKPKGMGKGEKAVQAKCPLMFLVMHDVQGKGKGKGMLWGPWSFGWTLGNEHCKHQVYTCWDQAWTCLTAH